MANQGRPHSNGSQFYVTLRPQPWMDKKYVAFGRVIEGWEVLRAIEAEAPPSTSNQRPLHNVVVSNCGVWVPS